jgi:hypothetical protein
MDNKRKIRIEGNQFLISFIPDENPIFEKGKLENGIKLIKEIIDKKKDRKNKDKTQVLHWAATQCKNNEKKTINYYFIMLNQKTDWRMKSNFPIELGEFIECQCSYKDQDGISDIISQKLSLLFANNDNNYIISQNFPYLELIINPKEKKIVKGYINNQVEWPGVHLKNLPDSLNHFRVKSHPYAQ